MRCAWKELLGILPPGIRSDVDKAGREVLQELRLRINAPPELVTASGSFWLHRNFAREDLDFVVNAATHYSPWTASSAARGYITAPGGHRIGLCGEVVCKDGVPSGLRTVSSLCIRVARDFPGIAAGIGDIKGSVLILGAPGWGKTTLLRDLIRQLSAGQHVAVIDERRELFPEGFARGRCQDTLSGCPKGTAVEMVLRTMGPQWIAVDEITAEEDVRSLVRSAGCGVRLLATAHAGCLEDFYERPIYHPLWKENIFQTLVLLKQDRTFTVERMKPCISNGLVPC